MKTKKLLVREWECIKMDNKSIACYKRKNANQRLELYHLESDEFVAKKDWGKPVVYLVDTKCKEYRATATSHRTYRCEF